MTQNDDQIYQLYELSEAEELLRRLAQQYHEETEAYDRTVCSALRNGIAIPTTVAEGGLISRNARQTLERLAGENGVPRDALLRAIQQYEPEHF